MPSASYTLKLSDKIFDVLLKWQLLNTQKSILMKVVIVLHILLESNVCFGIEIIIEYLSFSLNLQPCY